MKHDRELTELAEQIERLWDSGVSMVAILGAVADVCSEKAQFVWETHQDKALSKSWERMAKAIEKAAEKVGTIEDF